MLIRGTAGKSYAFSLSQRNEEDLRLCQGIMKVNFNIKPSRTATMQRAIAFYSRYLESASQVELEKERNILVTTAKENPRKPYERKKKNA